MPITVLAAASELAGRVGKLLTLCGLTAEASPTDPTLVPAIGFAAWCLGITAATPGSIVDADLLALDPGRFYALCDLAEYRLLRTFLGNWTQTDEAIAGDSQQWAKFAQMQQDRLADLEKQYAGLLNPARNPPLVGGPPRRADGLYDGYGYGNGGYGGRRRGYGYGYGYGGGYGYGYGDTDAF